jgi:HSP20 family protein
MAEAATKLPTKTEKAAPAPAPFRPFEGLRREVDRLIEDFGNGFFRAPAIRSAFSVEPFWRGEMSLGATAPAVNVAETDDAYEITAELPGLDEKNIDVKLANGVLTIKGEKREEKEEKKKDYYLHERHFGSFQRSFQVPDGVDAEKVQAAFKNGVLTVTLPKSPDAQKAEKKIAIKAA